MGQVIRSPFHAAVPFAAVLTVVTMALASELLTRTDQTGGKLGNVIGLVCVAPFAVLFGFAMPSTVPATGSSPRVRSPGS
ncbi:hypothetical protein NN3_19750 [Nocardia neocaledoniensis NBRC 108232]|uniref:hypothetical protein n=1 Tax=Nocardia neocaledoniensis TaxID=236511 RepID=UPI001191191C|nr:hypothetical protein [Nocardia neocaledoniensis]GEM30968.1 hypothetical protein NN3_19750 [Nocardia neocaledoniensis NBRC 108232]